MPSTAYGIVALQTKLLRISGPSSQKYIKNESHAGVQKGFGEFDSVNQEVLDSIDWSKIEQAVNDQLPEEWQCKVVDF